MSRQKVKVRLSI